MLLTTVSELYFCSHHKLETFFRGTRDNDIKSFTADF